MKQFAIWLLIAAIVLSGCAASQDDPFRVDTVVQIPVDPTDAPTEAPTDAPTEPPTEEPTEAPSEAVTEPEETAAKKTTSSKGSSSGKGSSGKTQKPKETEPPVTEPPAIETVPPTAAPTEPPYDPSSYSVGSLEYALLAEFNAYRAEAGEAELSISGKLSGIAHIRAKEASSYWGHTRPDGRSYTSAMSDYGYGFGTSAELLTSASGSGDAASIVAKWMGSESTSASILSSSYSKVGIGVYRTGGVTYVACLLIG